MDGFIVVDKEVGITSHKVVAALRKLAGQKKVGHTGTLDPFATGVLPVALGEATKVIPFLEESVKEYSAVLRFGVATDTQDLTGQVREERDWSHLTPVSVQHVFSTLIGPSVQVPPMFSALKQGGVRLYDLARAGVDVDRQPRPIQVFSISVEEIALPYVSFTIRCSRGTYVRTIAHDIGQKLGCGAHLTKLRRIASGNFRIDNAFSLEQLADQRMELSKLLISPYDVLNNLVDAPVSDSARRKLKNGVVPLPIEFETDIDKVSVGSRVRFSHGGELLAVAEKTPAKGTFRLLRVFGGLQ